MTQPWQKKLVYCHAPGFLGFIALHLISSYKQARGVDGNKMSLKLYHHIPLCVVYDQTVCVHKVYVYAKKHLDVNTAVQPRKCVTNMKFETVAIVHSS